MITTFLVHVFIVLILLFLYVNNRGKRTIVSERPTDMKNYFRFNATSCAVGQTRVDVWRQSSRNYCPDKIIPFFFDEATDIQSSYIVVHRKNSPEFILDTSSYGFGHYEDPRIIAINDAKYAIIFVRHFEGTGRMCIAVMTLESTLPSATFQFKCEKTEKNWMPEILNGTLNLYARVQDPQIIYSIPKISEASGNEIINVLPTKLGHWRGSSQFLYSSMGQIGLVHSREPSKFTNKFLPNYKHCFVILNDTFSAPFEVEIVGFPGFVYITGLEFIDSKFVMTAGISDCYAVCFEMTFEQVSGLFKTSELQKFVLEPTRVF